MSNFALTSDLKAVSETVPYLLYSALYRVSAVL